MVVAAGREVAAPPAEYSSDSEQSTSANSDQAKANRCPKVPLYAQVLLAIALAVLFGALFPDAAKNEWINALGTGFVKLIKMVITPIIFCTVVNGIAHVQDASKVGRVAIKAICYFEIVSTGALAIGLIAVNMVRPGDGIQGHSDAAAVSKYQGKLKSELDFVMNIIPTTVVSAFAEGDVIQVLFFAILSGFALMAVGDRAKGLLQLVEDVGHVFFNIIGIIMKVAPIGAFGAMAYTVGKYGVRSLGSLLLLVLTFYITAAFFVLFVLGAIAAIFQFNILRFLYYIKHELLLVVATSSSESALPTLLEKLQTLGCSQSIVGLVLPLGYSFNLDGTNIYMTLATVFIGQALGVHLTFAEQMKILVVAMLTSKGATGVTGAGFVTLASTLSAVRPELVPGMAMLLGVDKFMSECRAVTNLCGNSIATVVIAASENELDRQAMSDVLGGASASRPRAAPILA